MPGPNIDFRQIRPYGDPPSQSGAFEELASILVKDGVVQWPARTQFARFGNPDGGREGKGTLPNGEIWAWQAKYLFAFDASAARQVSESISRTLDLEPALRRYFVALPIDRPAGDTSKNVSAYTRWTTKVTEWQELARGKGMDVEFVFVGAHELLSALTEPRHEGRARYWFSTDVLTPAWQRRRLEEVVAKVGRRYSPQLHVEVDTVQVVEAVGRTDIYLNRWREVLAGLRRAGRGPWQAPAGVGELFTAPLAACVAAVDAVDDGLQTLIAAAGGTGALPSVSAQLAAAAAAAAAVDDLLREHCLTQHGGYVGAALTLHSEIQAVFAAVHRAEQLGRSSAHRAAGDKRLVLTGRAGVGKTHLLCDVAAQRISAGRPTLVVLGQDFDRRPLLPQIGELTQLGGTPDDVMGILDAAAQAAGELGLLMIDALNEGADAERWDAELRALRVVADRFPHVAVMVSCRTEFVEAVLGDDDSVRVDHRGFGEAVEVAVARFTREYGLEPPSFPILNPEFGNPLYLKLTCEALEALGATRFLFGKAGLVTVCTAYLEAVNMRLARPVRFDYDPRRNLVGRAVAQIAGLGRGPYDRDAVEQITETVLPGRRWSRSLLQGLLGEGVLINLSSGQIAFGYQRLGDVERAQAIVASGLDGVRTWLDAAAAEQWRERGVLGVLAVIVPEQHGAELADLAAGQAGAVPYPVVDSFLQSLLLRAPEHVGSRAVEIVERLLEHPDRSGETWERLVEVSCVPGQPVNAAWLHRHLAARPLADRDASWSIWLVASVDNEYDSPAQRLIRWAWPGELRHRTPLTDDVAKLAVHVFGWMLTCSDRRVRDRATKAIVSVGERAPSALAAAAAAFRGVDDPYVIERLAAAAAGVVLRTDPTTDDGASAVRAVADGVVELLGDGWPAHLLTRDYARRVYDAAAAIGWDGPSGRPPYSASWPEPTRDAEEIEALVSRREDGYSRIWFSVTGMSDFGRYVLRPALQDVVTDDAEVLRDTVQRAVFDRVLELGWTPQRFAAFDRGQASGRDSPIERVGKKYQWIALYETLGRIADHLPVKPPWSDEAPGPYDHAEQLIWRDVDPTVLTRRPTTGQSRGPVWFAPVSARLPDTVVDAYPADMDGVPDPIDLITVTDDDGTSWLALMGAHDWQQPLLTEVAALDAPRHQTWMHVHAYLVACADTDALAAWADRQDWFGRWMPDPAEPHNLLLGAYPDDPRWSLADGSIEWWEAGMSAQGGSVPPVSLWQSAAWYGGTGTLRDASAPQETRGHVPSRKLSDILGLGKGVDFAWSDTAGLAVHDPSVMAGGPSTLLLRRDLVPCLQAAGLTLFWTVLVGKELLRAGHAIPDDEYRWVSASASYLLKGDRIEQVHTRATRCRPGPETEADISWLTAIIRLGLSS